MIGIVDTERLKTRNLGRNDTFCKSERKFQKAHCLWHSRDTRSDCHPSSFLLHFRMAYVRKERRSDVNEIIIDLEDASFAIEADLSACTALEAPRLMIFSDACGGWLDVESIYYPADDYDGIIYVSTSDERDAPVSGVSIELANALQSVQGASHALLKHTSEMAEAYVQAGITSIIVEDNGVPHALASVAADGSAVMAYDKLLCSIEDLSNMDVRPVLLNTEYGNVTKTDGFYPGWGGNDPIVYMFGGEELHVTDPTSAELIRSVWELSIAITRDAKTLEKHLERLGTFA